MKKWEYEIRRFVWSKQDKKLKEIGEDGWEVVSWGTIVRDYVDYREVLLKREKEQT